MTKKADLLDGNLYIRDVKLAARGPDASRAGHTHTWFDKGGSCNTSHDDTSDDTSLTPLLYIVEHKVSVVLFDPTFCKRWAG